MDFFKTAIPLAAALLFTSSAASAQETEWKLANGLDVIHIRKPSSKVLASIVTVNVGSKDEVAETNGLSHLLEHMVFDGTPRRTRAEINEGSKRFGGYVNATTKTSYTSYISVFPAEFAELSLDLQADMLFNSTVPEQEFEKERKVVIEEIKKDRDTASSRAFEYHDELLYAGTPYARPVLGYENILASVPRATVLDYYHRHYVPSRMKAMIISPFPVDEVKKWMDKTFGAAPARSAQAKEAPAWSFPKPTAPQYKEDAVPAAFVHISLPAPALSDPDYFAYDLLTRYLADGGNSPLQQTVRKSRPALADSISASMESEIPFSVWRVSVVTQPVQAADVLEALRRTLQAAALTGIPEQELNRLQQQVRSQEAILWEQPHYYGLFKAPFINAQGFRFTTSYPKRLQAVTASEVRRVAERFFSNPNCFTTVVVPKGMVPAPDTLGDTHAWRRETLPSGLTLVAQGTDESDVFALCLLTRQRSALEPPELEGISDFVHRMLLRGTTTRSAEEIQRDLDRLSAQIQFVDNPFIPYDDHYTTNRFAFFRLEVLDDLRGPALDLISESASQSTFPEPEVEKVRQEILRLQKREADNASKRASQRLRAVLLAPTPYMRAVLGDETSIGKMSRTQLLEHFKHLYAPSNLVVIAVGRGTTDAVMRDLKSRFENLKGSPITTEAALPVPRTAFHTEHVVADKQQTQIAAGGLTAGWSSPGAAALRVLNAILSERLAVELRETQGLAYSVASELQQEQDYGWIEVRMGTRAEAAEQARQGVLAVVRKLATGDIAAEERERAINGLWGSTLRSRLSRIGQAFYRGIDEVRSSGYDAEERLLPALSAVKIEDLKRVSKAALNTDQWILISVGKQ